MFYFSSFSTNSCLIFILTVGDFLIPRSAITSRMSTISGIRQAATLLALKSLTLSPNIIRKIFSCVRLWNIFEYRQIFSVRPSQLFLYSRLLQTICWQLSRPTFRHSPRQGPSISPWGDTTERIISITHHLSQYGITDWCEWQFVIWTLFDNTKLKPSFFLNLTIVGDEILLFASSGTTWSNKFGGTTSTILLSVISHDFSSLYKS